MTHYVFCDIEIKTLMSIKYFANVKHSFPGSSSKDFHCINNRSCNFEES